MSLLTFSKAQLAFGCIGVNVLRQERKLLSSDCKLVWKTRFLLGRHEKFGLGFFDQGTFDV